MTLANPQKEYLSQRVQSAPPMELIRLLYEAALQGVEDAKSAIQSGEAMQRGRAVTRVVEILSELRLSLRPDVQQEYCNTLASLYTYMQQQLLRAHAEQSPTLFEEVRGLLKTLLEGWMGAMEKMASESMTAVPAAPEKQPEQAIETNPYSQMGSPGLVRSWQL